MFVKDAQSEEIKWREGGGLFVRKFVENQETMSENVP